MKGRCADANSPREAAEHGGPVKFVLGGRPAGDQPPRRARVRPIAERHNGDAQARAGSVTDGRNYRDLDPDGVAETEAGHFTKCPG